MKAIVLKKLTSKVDKWSPSKEAPDGVIEYIDIASVDRLSKSISRVQQILGSEAPSRARQLVKSSDVLVSTVRPNLNAVALVSSDLDGATASTGYSILRAVSEELDARYLFHWVKTNQFIDEMVGCATGASYPAVSDKIVKDSKIPLPPLPEQKRIAAILDKADELRQKRRLAIAKLDELLQATFLDMFGDPVTNPKGWEMKPLLEVLDFTTGSLDSNAAVEGGKYPFFTCAQETFAINDYAFDVEALLLAGNNAAGVYSIKHYSGKFNAYQRTYVITVKENGSYEYFKSLIEFKLKELQRISKGTNTKYLTMEIFKRMKIAVPPLDEQVKYKEIIKHMMGNFEFVQKSSKNLNNLFSALQQRAFKGQL